MALGTGVFAVLAEAWHARRTRRVARLAFGPLGQARLWTRLAPPMRVLALTAMAWGFVTLFYIRPRVASFDKIPEGGYRHLVITWDVSPSMQLDDGGFDSAKQKKRTRAQRGAGVLLSLFERIALDQVRISVVAFFTGAKPVVVDTHDLNVVKNILDDLPLDMAFDPGKTSLIDGIEESVKLAKDWKPNSTTLLVVSDGDTVPDTGLPRLPPSINRAKRFPSLGSTCPMGCPSNVRAVTVFFSRDNTTCSLAESRRTTSLPLVLRRIVVPDFPLSSINICGAPAVFLFCVTGPASPESASAANCSSLARCFLAILL